MESNRAEIRQLQSRLEVLINKQTQLRGNFNELQAEIRELHARIEKLSQAEAARPYQPQPEQPVVPKEPVVEKKVPEPTADKVPPVAKPVIEKVQPPVEPPVRKEPKPTPVAKPVASPKPQGKSTIESFLGENLANKIGIAIILIGIGVGVKYAIDKDLLGPVMRIALGYLAGAILIGFAVYLKKKYENLSAVMFAGGMAVAYIVTFIGYDFYQLFPKMVAFGSMLLFTVITSLAAIRYNKQIIAIVGLVGAYAVPFLLQDNTGTTFALFGYMTIINAGILYLAFRKNWQPVFAVAFGCTWFIFLVLAIRAAFWLESDYETLFIFSIVFYVMFYAMLIANKMKYKEGLEGGGTAIVILNSVFGYVAGIVFANAIYDNQIIDGVYTLLFAASQGLVTFITTKQKDADHRLYYLSFGFMLIYATLAIPMMFDGSWITIMWSLQAAVFFWIGWKKEDGFFEKTSYIPILLAFISLLISWSNMDTLVGAYPFTTYIPPIFNEYFLSSIVLAGVIFTISYFKTKVNQETQKNAPTGFSGFLSNALVYFGVMVLFISMLNEIDIYWDQREIAQQMESDLFGGFFWQIKKVKTIWMLIFSLIFTGALQLGNRFLWKNSVLAFVLGTASAVAVLAFLSMGLFNMSIIRDQALSRLDADPASLYSLIINIRYIGYAALAFALSANWFSLRQFYPDKYFKQVIEIIIHICLVWIVCSELIHLKRMNGGGDFYRAGLTIFGGIYAFGLIAFGIWKKRPHLRIMALVLFGITLLKLFVYDIAKVDTGGKTIAFISLGVLLLIISFLYTKYKHLILGGDEEESKEATS
ncbi:MAG: DUF2339 domain-containing protein [Crocinitomicaceae bacterium]|nr:DUF2339 domain-containing protein [Crocinitomicaceae bacterium]